MSYAAAYLALGVLWLLVSLACGAALAALAKRMHPALSFRRLWLFYSLLLGFAVAAVFVIGVL